MSQAPIENPGDLSTPTHLTESERLRLLSEKQRRVVLDVLEHRECAIDLRDLAAEVARRATDSDEPDPDRIERVTISLHHKHLPKLAAYDVVSYDRETKQIS